MAPLFRWDQAESSYVNLRTGARVSPRDLLVSGTFVPSAETTGAWSADADLEPVDSAITYDSSYNGQLIENKLFRHMVYVSGQNIRFRNCKFIGPDFYVTAEIVHVRANTARDIEFIDCTIKPRYVDHRVHCIAGHGMKLLRCDISGGVDGVGVTPYTGGTWNGRADVEIEASFIHDLAFWSPDPTKTDNQTHNDPIQWHGGAGLRIFGCLILGYLMLAFGDIDATHVPAAPHLASGHEAGSHFPPSSRSGRRRAMSGVMVSPGNGTHGELDAQTNWIDGGYVGFNFAGATSDWLTADGSTITDNFMGLDWRHTEERGTFTVANSFGFYRQSAGIPGLLPSITGNHLWNPLDDFDRTTASNVVQTNAPAEPYYP